MLWHPETFKKIVKEPFTAEFPPLLGNMLALDLGFTFMIKLFVQVLVAQTRFVFQHVGNVISLAAFPTNVVGFWALVYVSKIVFVCVFVSLDATKTTTA